MCIKIQLGNSVRHSLSKKFRRDPYRKVCVYEVQLPPQTILFMISMIRASDLNPDISISSERMIVRPGPRAKEREGPEATKAPKICD